MNLKGNSGCNIERQDGVVVKSAVGSYVPRLREQAYKQMASANLFGTTYNLIVGTSVLNIVEDTAPNGEPRIQVTMPYIKGSTVAQELLSGNKGISAAKDLSSFIGKNFAFNNILNSYDIFKNKCDDMIKKTPELKEELEWFLQTFQSDLQTLRAGYCHGDLTLENVIAGKWKASEDEPKATRALYLIDFLDSFIDTPFVDAATVLQDCLCHWSYRYDALEDYQIEYLNKFTVDFLENFYNEGLVKQNFLKTIFIFLLFKIYRIVPYAKDNVTKEWCDKNIKYIKNTIDIINGMEFPNVWKFIKEMDLLPKRVRI